MGLLCIESTNPTQYLGMYTTTTATHFDENCALVGQLSWTESSKNIYLSSFYYFFLS